MSAEKKIDGGAGGGAATPGNAGAPKRHRAAHTPGPWEVTGAVIVWSPSGKATVGEASEPRFSDVVQFQHVRPWSEDLHEAAANAQLMAAAPDLAAACQEVHATLAVWLNSITPPSPRLMEKVSECARQVEDALRKAGLDLREESAR